jgi:IS30 family transposase
VVENLLRQEWSPEQIAGWLKGRRGITLSHEWIYQYILADKRAGGDLHKHLRCQKKRRKRYGRYDRRGKLANTVSIEQRPAIVAQRLRLGDWEVDTIVGQGRRSAVVTLTERKSRLARLAKVDRKTAELVSQAIQQTLKPLQDQVHTITTDNGKEFAHHETLAAALEAEIYFAHPFAAWERGANENMNGLVRQYLPKNLDLATISEPDLHFIMDRLNNRPRKSLGFQTPNEVFFQSSVALSS